MAWVFPDRTNKYVPAWTDVTGRLETTTTKLDQPEIEDIIIEVENTINLECGYPSGWGDLTSKTIQQLSSVEVLVMTLAKEAAIQVCLNTASSKLEKSLVFKHQSIELNKAEAMNNVLRSVFEKNSRIRKLVNLIRDAVAVQIDAAPAMIIAPTEHAKWTWEDGAFL